jgi:hypothetical protein
MDMLFHGSRSYLATALASLAIAALSPALAQASEIAFTFTGYVEDPNNPFSNTPFAVSFDVNTLDPANTLTDTFEGGFLQTVSINVFATDFNATLGGVPVAINAPGGLTLLGVNPVNTGTATFFGPAIGFGGTGFNVEDTPHFGLATASQAAIQGSSDPLGLLLSGFSAGSDDPGLLFTSAGLLSSDVIFVGTAAAVPEPGIFGLLLLGFFGLIIVGPLTKRRRACANYSVPHENCDLSFLKLQTPKENES